MIERDRLVCLVSRVTSHSAANCCWQDGNAVASAPPAQAPGVRKRIKPVALPKNEQPLSTGPLGRGTLSKRKWKDRRRSLGRCLGLPHPAGCALLCLRSRLHVWTAAQLAVIDMRHMQYPPPTYAQKFLSFHDS